MSCFNVGYLIGNILCRKRLCFVLFPTKCSCIIEKFKAVDWSQYFRRTVYSIEIKFQIVSSLVEPSLCGEIVQSSLSHPLLRYTRKESCMIICRCAR